MIYKVSPFAITLFFVFVGLVLGLSFYFARKAKSSKNYFAAGGTIHWAVNGIAFAGDYLSAASFLGICGLIATCGYDGFLYSIGYLAGWIVALFIVAEPLKKMGEYTFADALDSKFKSRGIQLMAGISTLIVSICYLIPQMVGAGDLVTPLLGLPHHYGVILVGIVVTIIVATAGMTSTTYVQFIKGGLLIVFSSILVIAILFNGLKKKPYDEYHQFQTIEALETDGSISSLINADYSIISQTDNKKFVKLSKNGVETWWLVNHENGKTLLKETLSMTKNADGSILYNGEAKENNKFYQIGHLNSLIVDGRETEKTGSLNPFNFLSIIEKSSVVSYDKNSITDQDKKVTIWTLKNIEGKKLMKPGMKFKIDKSADGWSKLNFISLMIALFLGTAALPHILIRYYTVPDQKSARKSTIVAIAGIGFFYILTLYMGFGAMVNGVLDVESSNMAAPLLARSISMLLFAIISAIAFATVLGTVSGLIVASSGAIAHDLISNYMKIKMNDDQKVFTGKIAALSVGIIAIGLGILFKGMNVSYLVGLAFAVAASANLPAIIMLLFWKKTTSQGITASIFVGMVSAIIIISLSPELYEKNFGLGKALLPIDNPAIVSVPLSFLTLVIVSLLTKKQTSSTPVKKSEVKEQVGALQ